MLSWFKRRRRTDDGPEATEDRWTIAETEEDGHRLILRFRSRVPPGIDTSRYPHLMNLYWRYEGGNEGMPPSEDQERMVELEERLDAMEGTDCGFLVLVVTGNSRKEWVWYAADVETYLGRLNDALMGQEPFPIEIETSLDPTWVAYMQLLAPSH